MINKERMTALKQCPQCRLETVTSETRCSCGANLIVVVYSILDGRRITKEVS
jgi:hypothetical protein